MVLPKLRLPGGRLRLSCWEACLGLALVLLSPARDGSAGDKIPDNTPAAFPKPAASKADEPLARSLSLARGGEYLDRAAMTWARDRNCSSCHTSYPFLMARPMLGDAKAPALLWLRKSPEDRVAGWDAGGKG